LAFFIGKSFAAPETAGVKNQFFPLVARFLRNQNRKYSFYPIPLNSSI
jgi:hypothetical protein